MTDDPGSQELLTQDQACDLVSKKIDDLGGPTKASQTWDCSLQMVHLVRRGERKPTQAMLQSVGLEEVKEVRYQRKQPT